MNARPPIYSTFFTTLYDEPCPLTDLGSGAHHSVLRSVHWLDIRGNRLLAPRVHHVAVVWDAHHDLRVIEVLEQLHLRHLLGPIAVIGKNRGALNLLLHSDFLQTTGSQAIASYLRRLDDTSIGPNDGEYWTRQIGTFVPHPLGRWTQPMSLIDDDPDRVKAYLSSIDTLWGLGTLPWRPRGSAVDTRSNASHRCAAST